VIREGTNVVDWVVGRWELLSWLLGLGKNGGRAGRLGFVLGGVK
jgi:hypothetical protein